MFGDDGATAESFRAFVAARRPALHRAAYLLTGEGHAADDLVQTALLRAAGRWRQLVSRGDPEAYVRRILYTAHVSAWRRLRGREILLAGPVDRTSAGTPADLDTRVVLLRALARLTARQRAVLVLRFYEDLSESRTAELLGCSIGTVKSQTRHALRRLRELSPELVDLAPEGAVIPLRPGQPLTMEAQR